MTDTVDKLKILFVEDIEADYELAVDELTGQIEFESIRVENSSTFEKALSEFHPDIVISDYSMPQFNGMLALKITKEHNESLPFIILTGTLNEEIAVDCMKAGATDYVIKEHIGKLPFAVKEANRLRIIMNEKLKAENDLLESESRYRSIFEKNQVIMLLVNPYTGEIIDANPAAVVYYGFSKESLPVKLFDIVYTDDQTVINRLDLALKGELNHILATHRFNNGMPRDVEVFCSPVNYLGKTFLHLIIQDITERNRAIEGLHKSLNEKKDLISEIFHRTKNSMQIMISLFYLQSTFEPDQMIKKILKDMENRIRAMALVHDKLYQQNELSRLSLKDYLTELVLNIISEYGIKEEKIRTGLYMDDIDVLIDSAIPCGLVVNELVSNVIKHAFPGDMKGIMEVYLTREESGEIILSVADTGAGAEWEKLPENIQSMGLQIAKYIVEYQLKGSIEQNFNAPHGIKWIIRFMDDKYSERI